MNKLTGNKLQIGSFAVSLPFKLSLYDINYDRKFIFDEVEINLNPVKILKGPLYAITEININKATGARCSAFFQEMFSNCSFIFIRNHLESVVVLN